MNEIHTAARTGDLDEISRLVASGAPVDAYEEISGQTPLMAACTSSIAGADMVRLLIESGADVNASLGPSGLPERAYAHMEPEQRAAVLEHRESLAKPTPMILAVVEKISCEKLRLLIQAGTEVDFKSNRGPAAVMKAAWAGNMDAFDLLIELVAGLGGIPKQGPRILEFLSRTGRFAQIRRLLDLGMDPTPLAWTPLMHAVAFGSLEEAVALVKLEKDLEAVDSVGRTAFLLSVAAGEVEKASMLLACGAKRSAAGELAQPALFHAVTHDDTAMVRWLLDQGFDPDESDYVNRSPLMMADKAPGCFRLLLDAGADPEQQDIDGGSVIEDSIDVGIARLLVERGINPGRFSKCVQRELVGLGNLSRPSCSKEDYRAGRCRSFGNSNPEPMDIPFWREMVRCGSDAFHTAVHFHDWPFAPDDTVWSHDRRGMSLTALPDGRFVHIGGRDDLLPLWEAFCIHNDAVVYDGHGEFEILGYPAEIFPPVEFHSATYVAPWIYIIGNASYPQVPEVIGAPTPVYRLHAETGVIEGVASFGDSPGWIHEHRACLEGGKIRVWGGRAPSMTDSRRHFSGPQADSYWFDPANGVWERISKES